MTKKTKTWLVIGAGILLACRYFFGTWNPIEVAQSFKQGDDDEGED